MSVLKSISKAPSGDKGIIINGEHRYLRAFEAEIVGDILIILPVNRINAGFSGRLKDVEISGVKYDGDPDGAIAALEEIGVGNFNEGGGGVIGDYLPLSGGTMEGDIMMQLGKSIRSSVNNNARYAFGDGTQALIYGAILQFQNIANGISNLYINNDKFDILGINLVNILGGLNGDKPVNIKGQLNIIAPTGVKALYNSNEIATVNKTLPVVDLASTDEVLTGEMFLGKPVYARTFIRATNADTPPFINSFTWELTSLAIGKNGGIVDQIWVDTANSFWRSDEAQNFVWPLSNVQSDSASNIAFSPLYTDNTPYMTVDFTINSLWTGNIYFRVKYTKE